MNAEILRKRIEAGENQHTEFKTHARRESVGPVICGFLNSGGGTLFCGVKEPAEVVGVEGDAWEVARKLEFHLKRLISPTPFFTTDVFEMDGAAIVAIDVPEGIDGPYVFEGAVWLRRNEEIQPADIDTLRKLILDRPGLPERWERQLSPMMTSDDLDASEVQETIREASEQRRFAFTDASEPRMVLKELAAFTSGGFTQGGDVLFSKTPSIRHPQVRAQFAVFRNSKADLEYRDNRWFEGPLVRVCRELMAAVDAINPVRSIFSERNGQRSDLRAYDPAALREGIVNAIVHRDYSAYSGGLRISVYPDRIEIWNSGRLPSGLRPNDLRRSHPSILINPDIAQVFYLRGFMEKLGRGTEYIASAARRLGTNAPQWKTAETGVTLTIYAATRSLADMTLNDRQQRLLDHVEVEGRVSLREYLHRFAYSEVSDRQARRDLEELVRAGYFVVEGAGPSTLYKRQR